MKKKLRLSSEERRSKIIDAARHLFSEKGFHGVTTRELAVEAGVSEALIFQHFPSKEAIYAAMLALCQNSENWSEAYKLLELEPSTSTLAIMLHFIGKKVLAGDEEMRSLHRLMLRSLSEDGEYARVVFKHITTTWVAKLDACAIAAWKAGDLRDGLEKPVCAGWLAQHIFLMLAFSHTPVPSAANYTVPRSALLENAVIFCLRGVGVRDDAIKKYYNPKAFGLLAADAVM